MSHVRIQLRDAVVAALKAELGDTAAVHASRILPLEEADLPAVLVYTNEEAVSLDGFASLERNLSLIVECVAQGADLDAKLDPLLVAAEVALNGNTLGGLALRLLPLALETSMSTDGAAPVGRARLTFEALYRTSVADPETST